MAVDTRPMARSGSHASGAMSAGEIERPLDEHEDRVDRGGRGRHDRGHRGRVRRVGDGLGVPGRDADAPGVARRERPGRSPATRAWMTIQTP